MQPIDHMIDVLDRCDLNPIRYIGKSGSLKSTFLRYIKFKIRNVEYHIEWWANVAYLSVGGKYENYLPFTSIVINSTWPSYKNGLVFYNEDDQSRFYVAIKQLNWQAD